jgi:hypothetical protein
MKKKTRLDQSRTEGTKQARAAALKTNVASASA